MSVHPKETASAMTTHSSNCPAHSRRAWTNFPQPWHSWLEPILWTFKGQLFVISLHSGSFSTDGFGRTKHQASINDKIKKEVCFWAFMGKNTFYAHSLVAQSLQRISRFFFLISENVQNCWLNSMHSPSITIDESIKEKPNICTNYTWINRMKRWVPFKRMAGSTGLEPAASGVTGQCCNQTQLRPPNEICCAIQGSNI